MENTAVLIEKRNHIAIVTLNLPQSLNALVQPLMEQLGQAAAELDRDPEVGVIVLTGAGRAFCAGGDLQRFTEGFDAAGGAAYMDWVHGIIRAWASISKPTIAAVNGHAVGAGLSLTLLCDLAYLADSAKLGCAFVNMGLVADCGLGYYLPRAVGLQRAKELCMTGRMISAQEAYEMGIGNGVVPADRLMQTVLEKAAEILSRPAYAVRMAKRLLDASPELDLTNLLRLEGVVQAGCFLTEDSQEAVSAFLQKRTPTFHGK